MSILDTNTVDFIGTLAEQDLVVLSIADHLEWGEGLTNEHLLLLQEKINTYLRYIESGEIYTSFPSARGKNLAVRVYFKHEPPHEAQAFIQSAAHILQGGGVGLETVVEPERGPAH
ncbi:MAG: hypothetical protein JO067_07720 [Cupriavidus sp.]|nr:hypothetical protein [Cupriavidus sp.]